MIPELEVTRSFVGITGCTASCSGPGCDCFFLGSACLFYRIYAVPQSDDIYEIFKCTEWNKQMRTRVQITSMNSEDNKSEKTEARLAKAKDNDCRLNPNCDCTPAESEMHCACQTTDLPDLFNTIKRILPAHNGHWRIQNEGSTVSAVISEEVSTEVSMRIKEKADVKIVRDTDKCWIQAEHVIGCYACAAGSRAEISCFSQNNPTIANVKCGKAYRNLDGRQATHQTIIKIDILCWTNTRTAKPLQSSSSYCLKHESMPIPIIAYSWTLYEFEDGPLDEYDDGLLDEFEDDIIN
uniref:Phlebovirus glycoprotein G2 fusion domain-containing protein n=1 Tax=Caenorhabditis japonica TaxID=281687 RepID=A0A8R1DF01_CAEJA